MPIEGPELPLVTSGQVDAALNYVEMSPTAAGPAGRDVPARARRARRRWIRPERHPVARGVRRRSRPDRGADRGDRGGIPRCGCADRPAATRVFLDLFPGQDARYVEASWARVCALLGDEIRNQTAAGWQTTIDRRERTGAGPGPNGRVWTAGSAHGHAAGSTLAFPTTSASSVACGGSERASISPGTASTGGKPVSPPTYGAGTGGSARRTTAEVYGGARYERGAAAGGGGDVGGHRQGMGARPAAGDRRGWAGGGGEVSGVLRRADREQGGRRRSGGPWGSLSGGARREDLRLESVSPLHVATCKGRRS